MVAVIFVNAHPPVTQGKKERLSSSFLPKSYYDLRMEQEIQRPCGFLLAHQQRRTCTAFFIIDETVQTAGGGDCNGRGLAVAQRRGAGSEPQKLCAFLVGQVGECDFAVRDQAAQETMFAISAAGFMFKLVRHDEWHENVVRNGFENALSESASVEVNQNARVENKRRPDITQ